MRERKYTTIGIGAPLSPNICLNVLYNMQHIMHTGRSGMSAHMWQDTSGIIIIPQHCRNGIPGDAAWKHQLIWRRTENCEKTETEQNSPAIPECSGLIHIISIGVGMRKFSKCCPNE